ncbi:DUF6493 family protein [Actinomadura alba]|uniref:Secreted protein n=1 Tax=Actinomadura alba TaxID=406431 RepID=A0ABR7LZN9_9ACTN|nr:DUF6493 family protein [Actinomadura alba]MBC6470329.1 hypothetical protein [Actinomadura alba]
MTSPDEAWDEVRALVEAGDAGRTADRVERLTGPERRAVGAKLPGYLRERRDADPFREPNRKWISPLRVAGAGCLGGAAATAAWLCRTDLRLWSFNADAETRLITRVVAARPAEWRAEVARRIAARIRLRDLPWPAGPNWVVAAELIRGAGAEPPPDDAFTVGWVRWTHPAELHRDPFLDALVPRLFEADGVGEVLRPEPEPHPHTWAGALTALAAGGRLDRDSLLDGCLSRFLRGGTARELRWFVSLHEALEPSLDEVRARLRGYVRLLPTASGPVLDPLLREVRRADEAEPLDAALFAEAASALLLRPEKKPVRAALGWLDRTARSHGRVNETLIAVSLTFAAQPADLSERAVRVAVKHFAKAGDEARRAVCDAAAALPDDLRERVAAAYGPVASPAPAAPGPLPPPPAPRDLPPPIGSPAELAEEAVALLSSADPDWAASERLLAGLVSLVHDEPERTRATLERLVPAAARWVTSDTIHLGHDQRSWLGAAVRAAMAPRPRGPSFVLSATRAAVSAVVGDRLQFPVPHRVIRQRMREVISSVGRLPVLLATPTSASGHIDPGRLVARLELLEEAGAKPPPTDLEQALLRLPREPDSGAAARAGRLASPAGRAVAARLAAGAPPDPKVTYEVGTVPTRMWIRWDWRDVDVARALPTVTATGERGITAKLCRLPEGDRWERAEVPYYYGPVGWWPALMPSHREVIAAHLIPHLHEWTDQRNHQGAALLGLAEADGPPGAAMATALAYGLGTRHQDERAATVDALLVLSGRGRLPAAELGAAISNLVRHRLVKLNRVTAALADAARAGAYTDMCTAITAVLPDLLPAAGEKAAAGLPDLLAVAAESAEAVRARAVIPELADVAARGGSSRLVREAVRLQRTLAAP